MRGRLLTVPALTKPAPSPFSPVRLRDPDLRAHPAFARSRRLQCDVRASDVLYIPAYWWHEVTSLRAQADAADLHDDARQPASAATASDCGLTASINYFFTPFYRKGSDLRHFAHEPFYDFLRTRGMDAAAATHADRWRQAAPRSDKQPVGEQNAVPGRDEL